MKNQNSSNPNLSIGIIADLQYCDADPEMNRYFRNAPQKLSKVTEKFNTHKLDFVVNLGDTIDHDWQSFDGILPLFQKLQAPVYHVLGNHDYEVKDEFKPLVHEKIGTKKYFDFSAKNWRFVVLDGNEISTYANIENTINHQLAEDCLKQQMINSNFWNGGIGKHQLSWLEQQLIDADQKQENVIIFCHFPVYPAHRHNLLNDIEVLQLLEKYNGVKAWISGHNHDGNYGCRNDIHFINMKGMVDFESQLAFSIIEFDEKRINIVGFGNEISAKLVI